MTFAPQLGVPSGNFASRLLMLILTAGRLPMFNRTWLCAGGRLCASPFLMSTEVGFDASSIQYCSEQLSMVASSFTTSGSPCVTAGVAGCELSAAPGAVLLLAVAAALPLAVAALLLAVTVLRGGALSCAGLFSF